MAKLQDVIKGLETQLDDLRKFADENEPLTLTQERAKEILELLKEQEEIELCDRCGRRRLKSSWEGR